MFSPAAISVGVRCRIYTYSVPPSKVNGISSDAAAPETAHLVRAARRSSSQRTFKVVGSYTVDGGCADCVCLPDLNCTLRLENLDYQGAAAIPVT